VLSWWSVQFGEIRVGCSSTHGAPRAQPFVKVGGTCPSAIWSRRHWAEYMCISQVVISFISDAHNVAFCFCYLPCSLNTCIVGTTKLKLVSSYREQATCWKQLPRPCVSVLNVDKQRDTGNRGHVVRWPPQRVSLWVAVGALLPLCRAVNARALEWSRRQTVEEQPRRQSSGREIQRRKEQNDSRLLVVFHFTQYSVENATGRQEDKINTHREK